MSRATLYPPADRTAQWFGNGNATVTPTAVLWHTTETAGGWPGYQNGGVAPNLTYEPWQHRWRQHFPLNGTSRALSNGPNYQTNRMGVCQVEISCVSDPRSSAYATRGIHRLDDQAFADLGAFASFMAAEWAIPLALTVFPFEPVPASGSSRNRFSPNAFPPFAGHCGHQHAPYNDHGDPGDLDVNRIIAASSTDPREDDMTPEQAAALTQIQTDVARLSVQAPKIIAIRSDETGEPAAMGYVTPWGDTLIIPDQRTQDCLTWALAANPQGGTLAVSEVNTLRAFFQLYGYGVTASGTPTPDPEPSSA